MYRSDEIKDLVAALVKAQGAMKAAAINKINPHFKSKYADFASCMDACREPLSENGIAVMQFCENVGEKLNLVTMLAHTSGQWIKSYLPLLTTAQTMQALGSAITYAKRYALTAALGIVADEELDDDGERSDGYNHAPQEYKKGSQAQKTPTPINSQKISHSQVIALQALDAKLDKECRTKLHSWLSNSLKVDRLEDVLMDSFSKVLGAFENAVKFMEQQKIEVVNG